jgi:hypothetical protein
VDDRSIMSPPSSTKAAINLFRFIDFGAMCCSETRKESVSIMINAETVKHPNLN